MMMAGYPEQLYKELTHEIACISSEGLTMEKETEKCFGASIRFDRKLHSWLGEFHFGSEQEEIDFFKLVKPKFTSSIHYYTKLYQALMLVPPELIEHVLYYTNELSKIEKFFADHIEFCEYYKNGATDKDREYFMRTSREKSAKDMLLGEIIGLEKYKEYLQAKLRERK